MTIWPLDDVDYTAESIGAFAGTRSRGVFAAEDCFRVSPAGGFKLRMTGGLAWLKKDRYWGVALLETADTTVTVDVGSGQLPRYVAVALLLDKTANKPRMELRYGEYAASPQKPQPRRDAYFDEIIVATVLQRAGAVEITAGDITDERTNETMCGLMRDAVERLPLDGLTDQMRSEFDSWFAKVKGQLSEDAAGHLLQQITGLEPKTIQPYTAQAGGGKLTLTGTGENIRFVAPADYAGGMKIVVNGQEMTAKTAAGEPLWPGFFVRGSVVICYKNGNTLTFNSGGLTAADKQTVRDWMVTGHSVQGGSVKGTVPVLGAKRWTPTTIDQQIPAGGYTGGVQTIAGDVALKPENIRKGVSLFLVPGTYDGDHKGLAASMFNTLMMGWGTAKVGSANRDLFDVSGNALIAKRELQLRFVTHVWCYYDWDQRTTVAGEFVVNGTKKANCTLQLSPQTQDVQTAADTMFVSAGTRIEFNTTATENWKACGGAVGFIEVM